MCLTGPADRQQLDDNLSAIEAGPLTADEETWVWAYGAQVKRKTPLSSLPLG